MRKDTVTGSLLAMILPATVAKHFLENASQEDVNKAEQEAAVLHQQLQAGIDVPPVTPPAAPVTPPAAPATTPVAPVAQLPLEGTAPTNDLNGQLSAMTTRATTAESSVTALTGQVASLTTERDQYKSWYQKIQGAGTSLPVADASNRGQVINTEQPSISAATAHALGLVQNRRQQA